MAKRYTIPELQQMRESEDHVEFKKVKEVTSRIMDRAKISLMRGDVAYWVMWPHFAMKEVVV